MKNILLLLAVFAMMANTAELSAQNLFESLLKKTSQKVGQKVSDKVEDQAAESISDAISRKVNEQLEEAMSDTSTDGNSTEYDGGEAAAAESFAAMEKMFGSMMGSDIVIPAKYVFDLEVKMKMTEGEEVSHTSWLLNESKTVFAMTDLPTESGDSRQQKHFVMDNENNVMVSYMQKDGEKVGWKMPNLNEFKDLPMEELDEESKRYEDGLLTITKTGKHPTIAGYACTEFRLDDETEDSYVILATSSETEITWNELFGSWSAMENMLEMPMYEVMQGEMVMRATTYNRADNSLLDDMIVEELKQKRNEIDNAEWNFAGAK